MIRRPMRPTFPIRFGSGVVSRRFRATPHRTTTGREENRARWKDNLKGLLSKHSRNSRGHHAALPYEKMPEFMAELRRRQAEGPR